MNYTTHKNMKYFEHIHISVFFKEIIILHQTLVPEILTVLRKSKTKHQNV